MDPFTQILTSLGVAAPAGFNAYLALLLVGLGGRIGWIDLASPYDALQGTAALALMAVLLTVEVIADKVPLARQSKRCRRAPSCADRRRGAVRRW
jgi:uncharacterized membrane protein